MKTGDTARPTARAPDDLPRPKTLGRLPIAGEPPALAPARMINEVLYCERLAYLEWAQGEFADNYFTEEGRVVHARVDAGGTTRKKARRGKGRGEGEGAGAGGADGAESEDVLQTRSLWLTSERLGLTAKIDLVEEGAAGRVVPVEHKRGKRPPVAAGAYLPERAQLGVQVLLLREYGYRCDEAMIYYAGDRQRVTIAVDDWLIAAALDAAARLREVVRRGVLPPPLVDDPKCNGCSLAGICLPDEVALLRRLEGLPADGDEVAPPFRFAPDLEGPMERDPWGLCDDSAIESPPLHRQLVPARDDRIPLYVVAQGGTIGLDGEELVVRSKEGVARARLPSTSQVCVLGNVQVTTQVIRALLERGIPLSFFTRGGWYLGRTLGTDTRNVELRIAQYRAAGDEVAALLIARGLVASKILNSRTMLRRNHEAPNDVALFELKQLARKAREAPSIPSLLGVEGTAARVYFGEFTGMLKQSASRDFDLDGRSRRPPRDPVNALLSFAYSLLTKDFAITLTAVGLDPLLGFLHQPRFGRPALALDLMEEFRPLVADSVVLAVLNTGVVDADDFVYTAGGCALSDAARRKFILAHERRMEQLVAHPVFGYRISYRRVIEVQARLLGRHLLGEIDVYPPFRTR